MRIVYFILNQVTNTVQMKMSSDITGDNASNKTSLPQFCNDLWLFLTDFYNVCIFYCFWAFIYVGSNFFYVVLPVLVKTHLQDRFLV